MSIEAITPYFPVAQPRPARPSAEVVRPFADPQITVENRDRSGDTQGRPGNRTQIDSRPRSLVSRSSLLDVQEQKGESNASSRPGELTQEQEQQVKDLKQRDAEVRRHEQAHAGAGGAFAGAPQYEFEKGPDGKNYAVGGHVQIDVAPVEGDPQATIRKMDVVRRAAAAPSEPSPEDRAVAAQAQQTRAEAQRELAEERNATASEPDSDEDGGAQTGTAFASADGAEDAPAAFVPFESLFGLAS